MIFCAYRRENQNARNVITILRAFLFISDVIACMRAFARAHPFPAGAEGRENIL
jgi:hypothetical protein